MPTLRIALTSFVFCMVLAGAAQAQVLFFSRSSFFEHSCIREEGGAMSHVCKILTDLAADNGGTMDCTKDGGKINAENLANYTMVIFFTQGDLHHTPSKADQPPVTEQGLAELLEWVKAGGSFMGFHCATDTMHGQDGEVTPYIEMVGGEFAGHGAQFEGTVRVVDEDHPTMASVPKEWKIKDEWYVFKNVNKDNIHVLALMDPGEERGKQPMYDRDPYPIAWCSKYGEGRVFVNGMGHREDVWTNETFQQHVVDAARWCMGEGDDAAAPNYAEVVGGE